MTVRKIISGGQTGVDIAAIDEAIALGIDWGGWVPKGRRQEMGKTIPASYDRFAEHASADWLPRTYANIEEADCTLIVAKAPLAGGTLATLNYAERLPGGRGLHVVCSGGPRTIRETRQWIREHASWRGPFTLNVAGPRGSKWPAGYDATRDFLRAVVG